MSLKRPKLGSKATRPSSRTSSVTETPRLGSRRNKAENQDGETELETVREQLTVEMRRNTMLDSELRLALSASHKAEEAHQKELKTSESDVKRLVTERRAILAKFADIEVVESSVRELYVQMKDRLAEDAPVPSPEQLRAEVACLEQEPILTVLGALRARLEGLWAFKVEAEDDLRGSRVAQQQRADAEASVLKADLRLLEAELRQTQKELVASKAETVATKEALARLADEARLVTEDMAAQHAELLAALKASVKEGNVSQRQAAAAFAEGKARDALVLANRQLESARHFDRVTQDKELRRLQHDHEVEQAEITQELGGLSYQALVNSQLKEQLQHSKSTIAQLRREVHQPTELKSLQHRVRLLEQELSSTQHSLSNALGKLTTQRPASSRAGSRSHSHWHSTDGPLTTAPPDCPVISPSSPSSPHPERPHPQKGRANESMTRSANAIMSGARVAAAKARQKAEEQVFDPLYHVIANVGAMNHAAKTAVRDVRHEVVGLGCSAISPATQVNQPQATAHLEAALQPGVKMLGAAGTNQKGPAVKAKHWPVVVK